MMYVEPSWMKLVEKLKSKEAKRIYVVGGSDSGKNLLSDFLVKTFSKEMPTGLIDCDPDQSLLGLPTTINAGFYSVGESEPSEIFTRFIGDTSLQRRPASVLLSIYRLVRKMDEKMANSVIFDSSGFVAGNSAVEFQASLIELLEPDVVVMLARADELKPLERQILQMGICGIEKLQVLSSERFRSMPVRKQLREEKYRSYFKDTAIKVLDIKNTVLCGSLPERFTVQSMRGRIIAFCDHQKFVIALGISRSLYETDQICICLAPEFDFSKISFLHFGNVFLSSEFKEGHSFKK